MSLFGSDVSLSALRQLPLEVAPETYVIRAITASSGGSATNLNSMIINGAEPMIVDTGMVTSRDEWFEDVFSLVRPDDVRWIYITHNDSDHAGNLIEALERCPNAQVIASKAESFRTMASFGVPLGRIRLVENGETFKVGDREFQAVRPPVYDSPYTRGLYDPATKVYYSSDAFCAPMPEGLVDRVDEIPARLWADGFAQFHHFSLCPWVSMVDQSLLEAEVKKLAALDIDVIVSAHSPVISGPSVDQAFSQLAQLPSTVPKPMQLPDLGDMLPGE